jgi:putative aldouronate transport system permease protein
MAFKIFYKRSLSGAVMKKSWIRGFFKEINKNKVLYSMFIPVTVYIIIFAYIPMTGIIVAFKNYNYKQGFLFSPWIGFDNFKYFFLSGKAWLTTRNTLLFNLLFLFSNNIVAIAAAVMLAVITSRIFKKVSQTIIFLPYFVSWVVVNAFVYNMFNADFGTVNVFLKSHGLPIIDIYFNPGMWWIYMPILFVWKGVGFNMVLYLSAIMGMDQSCYESATIDGASEFQKIRYITLPLLKPTVITLLLLGLAGIMKGQFDMFYQLIGKNPMLFDSTDIIDTLVFRSLVSNFDFGMASAAGMYQSVLCLIIIVTANYIIRRINKEYALF